MENRSSKLKVILFSIGIALVIFIIFLIIQRSYAPRVNVQEKKVEQKKDTQSEVNMIDYQPKEGIYGLGSDQTPAYINAEEYRIFVLESFKRPPDFYGHYKVINISCGLGCSAYEIIDKNTGKVYKVPEWNDFGNFPKHVFKPYTLDSNLIHVITNKGTQDKIYSFDGAKFVLSSSGTIKVR